MDSCLAIVRLLSAVLSLQCIVCRLVIQIMVKGIKEIKTVANYIFPEFGGGGHSRIVES